VLNDLDLSQRYLGLAEAARLREQELARNNGAGMDAGRDTGDVGGTGNVSQFHRNAVVTVNEDGIIQEVNAGVFKLFGYDSRNDLVQRNVNVLMPFPYRSLHDEFLSRYRTSGVRKIIGVRQTLFGQHRSGHAFPLQLNVVEMKGKIKQFAGLITPISDNESNGMILINSSGVMQMVNKRTCQMFGYKASELVGNNVTILMSAEYAGQHEGFLQRYLHTGNSRVIGTAGRNLSARTKGGKVLPISLQVEVQEIDGSMYFVGTITDMEQLTAEAYMDGLGTIRNVNEAFLSMFGYDRMNIVGQNIKLLMPEPYRSFHDGYLERFRRTRVSTILKASQGRILPGMHRDGSVFSINLIVKKIDSGFTTDMMFQASIRRIEETESILRAARDKVRINHKNFND
jgi:PAS domain S-box-containing protein